MSDRFTVQLDSDNADWVAKEADRRDRSKAWIINESLRIARGEDSILVDTGEVNTGEHHTGEVNTVTEQRVDDLEDRVAELEARNDGNPMAHERDARAKPGQPADAATPDDPSGVAEQNPSERAVSGSKGPAIEDVVADAYDNRQFREQRREIGRVALEWLREQSEPKSAEDFKNALHPEHNVNEQNEDSWWRTTVRPAVQAAADAGLVEYRSGHHDYEVA